MSRLSTDEVLNGHVHNGFDYSLQVWVQRGIIPPCCHPASMRQRGHCCNQNKYAGLMICDVPGYEVRTTDAHAPIVRVNADGTRIHF